MSTSCSPQRKDMELSRLQEECKLLRANAMTDEVRSRMKELEDENASLLSEIMRLRQLLAQLKVVRTRMNYCGVCCERREPAVVCVLEPAVVCVLEPRCRVRARLALRPAINIDRRRRRCEWTRSARRSASRSC